MDKDQKEQEYLSIIAYLYYYADMSQSDIADRLFLSRSTVSRLIKKARQSGVVELKINEPWQRSLPLEDQIKTAFGIDGVRVLDHGQEMSGERQLELLSQMTIFYLNCTLRRNTVLGVSWGNTIGHVSQGLSTMQNVSLTVVPIMGSMTWPEANPESLRLSERFARVYGGRFFPMDAPLFASSKEELCVIQSAPAIAEALEISRRSDCIVTSVGSIADRSWERYLGPESIERLKEIGCVGHIGGHFYDISGQEIDGKYRRLHVGLTLEEIRQNGNVFCVAASPGKAEAVYGALRGRLISTLVVTRGLAEGLMEISRMRSF